MTSQKISKKGSDPIFPFLNNERFVANAPEDVLAKNRTLLGDAQAKQIKVLEQFSSLRS